MGYAWDNRTARRVKPVAPIVALENRERVARPYRHASRRPSSHPATPPPPPETKALHQRVLGGLFGQKASRIFKDGAFVARPAFPAFRASSDASLEWFSTPPLWHTRPLGGVHTINARWAGAIPLWQETEPRSARAGGSRRAAAGALALGSDRPALVLERAGWAKECLALVILPR